MGSTFGRDFAAQVTRELNQARQQDATEEKLKQYDDRGIGTISRQLQPNGDIYDAEQAKVANQQCR